MPVTNASTPAERVDTNVEENYYKLKSEIRKLDGIDKRISVLQTHVQELKDSIKDMDTSSSRYNHEKIRLEEKEENLKNLLEIRNDIAHKVGGKRYIDKKALISTIKKKSKDKGVTLGSIEYDSGNSVGYLARLNTPESTALPSLEFVVTAARMLDVSVEDLIQNPGQAVVSDKERKILDFLSKLLTETKRKKLIWEKTEKERFARCHAAIQPKHVLASVEEGEYYDTDYRFGEIEIYKSQFLENGKTELVDDIYYSQFDNKGNVLYIAPVIYKKIGDNDKGKIIYEMYIADATLKEAKPVISSENVEIMIENRIISLYNMAKASFSSIALDEETESVLDDYINT